MRGMPREGRVSDVASATLWLQNVLERSGGQEALLRRALINTNANTPLAKPAIADGSGTMMRLGWTRVRDPLAFVAVRLTV